MTHYTSLHKAPEELDLLSHGADGPCSQALRLLLGRLIRCIYQRENAVAVTGITSGVIFDSDVHLRVRLDHLFGMLAGGFGKLGATEHAGDLFGALLSGDGADTGAGATAKFLLFNHVVMISKSSNLR